MGKPDSTPSRRHPRRGAAQRWAWPGAAALVVTAAALASTDCGAILELDEDTVTSSGPGGAGASTSTGGGGAGGSGGSTSTSSSGGGAGAGGSGTGGDPLPVLHWRFDEEAGPTAADDSGQQNDGTWLNEPSVTAGVAGNALLFDGVDDYVLASFQPLQGPPLSVTLWAKQLGTGGSDPSLLRTQPAGSPTGYGLFFYDGFLRVHLGTTADLYWLEAHHAPAEQWLHVAVTIAPSEVWIYVDGVMQGMRAVSGSMVAPTAMFRIGGMDANEDGFHGIIDEVRVYDVALSEAQILAQCQAESPPGHACVSP